MKLKKTIIIFLIFALPIFAYYLLTQNNVSYAKKSENTKPEIIKFTSQMCLDCQKLNATIKEVYPKYSEKIKLTEIKVEKNDSYTKEQIKKYNVLLVPTTIFTNDKETKRIEGYIPKNKLEKEMKALIDE